MRVIIVLVWDAESQSWVEYDVCFSEREFRDLRVMLDKDLKSVFPKRN